MGILRRHDQTSAFSLIHRAVKQMKIGEGNYYISTKLKSDQFVSKILLYPVKQEALVFVRVH